jgi:uncharacterized repeat protein (TIGR03803 family)
VLMRIVVPTVVASTIALLPLCVDARVFGHAARTHHRSSPAKVQFTQLHAFAGGADGRIPNGPLIADAAGNLYGTTAAGGPADDGVVFELSPPASQSGSWTETILYDFQGGADGRNPQWGLIADTAGNLYGTTLNGGSDYTGSVFQLSPPSSGKGSWTEHILHTFRGQLDGLNPYYGVTMDANGNLYGGTSAGGKYGFGTIFEVSPPPAGKSHWQEQVLYSFPSTPPLSGFPVGVPTLGPNGVLYGSAEGGGKDYSGVIYELTPPPAGKKQWSYQVIDTPVGRAGFGTSGSFYIDAAGALYSNGGGGAKRGGTVWKLSPPAPGKAKWGSSLLASFPSGTSLTGPEAPLTHAADGSFYGVTYGLSTYGGDVFHLVPPAPGKTKWKLETLYTITADENPFLDPGVLLDASGDIFGATLYGGINDNGIVYELTP